MKIYFETKTRGLYMLDLSLGSWWIWFENIWAVVYLVPSDTRVLEIYLLKNLKCYMMYSCMTNLKFLPKLDTISRLEIFHIYAACLCIEFCQPLWPLWEACHTFKIKIKHTPPKYGLRYTGVGAKTCHSIRSTQKCFAPDRISTK